MSLNCKEKIPIPSEQMILQKLSEMRQNKWVTFEWQFYIKSMNMKQNPSSKISLHKQNSDIWTYTTKLNKWKQKTKYKF